MLESSNRDAGDGSAGRAAALAPMRPGHAHPALTIAAHRARRDRAPVSRSTSSCRRSRCCRRFSAERPPRPQFVLAGYVAGAADRADRLRMARRPRGPAGAFHRFARLLRPVVDRLCPRDRYPRRWSCFVSCRAPPRAGRAWSRPAWSARDSTTPTAVRIMGLLGSMPGAGAGARADRRRLAGTATSAGRRLSW